MNQKNFYFILINYACENSFSQVDLVRNPEIKGYSVTPFLSFDTAKIEYKNGLRMDI